MTVDARAMTILPPPPPATLRPPREPRVVGLAGAAGSGKDTTAAPFVDAGWAKISFADPLKEFCAKMFGWSHETLYGDSSLRELPDLRRARADGTPLTPRHALRMLGTEWGRSCYPQIWVDYLHTTATRLLDEGKSVIVSDVRFDDEAACVRDLGGYVVHVIRPGITTKTDHVSEQGVTSTLVDFVLMNTGTKEDLLAKATVLLRGLAC